MKLTYPSSLQLALSSNSFFFSNNYEWFRDRLSLSYIFYKWSRLSPALNLNIFLKAKDSISPFIKKKFFIKEFLTNKFVNIIWDNNLEIGRKRLKRRFKSRNWFIWYDRQKKFLKTSFSKKYLKFLFYQRFFNWKILRDLSIVFPYATFSNLNVFYLRIIASQFAPKYSKLDTTFPNISLLPHLLIWKIQMLTL